MGARRFQLVPFGGRAPERSIACDGLVAGAALHLSHWSGNRTPVEFKRDTSTESALAYAAAAGTDASLDLVTNNHLDVDGVLSVFALVNPDAALAHADLLVAAAEVGDFDEWPEDARGLMLNAAVERLFRVPRSDSAAYEHALAALPDVLDHLLARRDLWREGLEELERGLSHATSGALETGLESGIQLFVHGEGLEELPGPVLFRLAPRGAKRWLLAFARGGGRWDYRYERPRYAWADTVARPPLPAPSRNRSVRELGPGWAIKGELGMTGICRTSVPSSLPPHEVLARLARSDPGLAGAA